MATKKPEGQEKPNGSEDEYVTTSSTPADIDMTNMKITNRSVFMTKPETSVEISTDQKLQQLVQKMLAEALKKPDPKARVGMTVEYVKKDARSLRPAIITEIQADGRVDLVWFSRGKVDGTNMAQVPVWAEALVPFADLKPQPPYQPNSWHFYQED